jgi:hypothetical protein
MPLHIMNQELYADRTVQDWHRRTLPRDHDAIDVDLVGVCHRSYCRDPLYWIESTTRWDKTATILRRFAEKTDAYGIVVVHDTETITGFRVVFDPTGTKWPEDSSERGSDVLEQFVTAIREVHDLRVHGG